MINASTHQGAERALGEHTQPVRRIGPRTFSVLLGLELVLMVGVLVWALVWLIPAGTPFAAQSDLTPVSEALRARLTGAVDDPLIEAQPGLIVRESNLRGVRYEGAIFYYYLEGAVNFDPLSRGAVSAAQVEILLRDESGAQPLVIYRLRDH